MNTDTTRRLSLETLPEGTLLRSVTPVTGTVAGRTGTRVRLADEIARHGVPGVDYIDQPTMVLLPLEFGVGLISVDIYADLTEDAPDYARGFAGIAFHVTPSFDGFQSVYIRPTNGTLTDAPLARPRHGAIGLFVDIGTDAYFADLVVTPSGTEQRDQEEGGRHPVA